MLCNLKAKELITCAVSPEGKDSGRVAPGLGGWAERKPLPSPSPCSELRWLLDKTEKSRGKHTCTHSRDSSFCPGAPGLCGLLTTSQGPLFLPSHCYPTLLSGLCSWRYSWGWEAGGALLGVGRCLPHTPAHGFLQLISLSLHGSSIQEAQGRALWLFSSKYLALLKNADINIYLRRWLLILKSICVKALRALKHTSPLLLWSAHLWLIRYRFEDKHISNFTPFKVFIIFSWKSREAL